ncbi:T9SS type A sorting domain-containing protein [Winogradskyella eckloniae]|uniref:T9SS type A sorting domain-containing protein n=1 Tax=Winogradskyella eckloniae TaxID=1089306 RepID=UPI001564A9E8|nr:T9SS type A sorting domain-containing protein [Winogradskyella eckloniae]NRD20411.1 T9SS type A sorting domain-containing protein [Winogradskyella eckloniae]
MNFITRNLYTLLLVCLSITVHSQSSEIVIDGIFDDWDASLTTFTDINESLNGIDIIELQVTNDDAFLFIKIKTNIEFDLTDNLVSQQIRLFLDTDNDANTGYNIQNGYGSEVGIIFKELFAHYNVSPYSEINFSDLKLRAAPTVTSNEFEIAIGRHQIPDGIHPLFPNATIKILLKNDDNFDKIPNEGLTFSYTFDDTPVTPYTPIDITKSHTDHIRLLAYNTLASGLNDPNRVDNFEQIIKAIAPDIIGLTECWDIDAVQVKLLFDTWFPLGTTNGWYTAKLGGLITVSRWEIIQQWTQLSRQFPVLIDLPSTYPKDLLFTNAHLNCCDADDLRQEQADQYAAFILDAKSPGGSITLEENTPFMYSGDLNLVGYSQQLTTLKTGDIQNTTTYGLGAALDWDDSDLTEENCLQTDLRMGYTWRSDGQGFPPGKLDFIIFSDYTLTAQKSFVLQTEVMPIDRLWQYNLNALDTSSASDHFPVVTDFSMNESLSTEIFTLANVDIYPNPTHHSVHIDLKHHNLYKIQVLNTLGNVLFTTAINSNSTDLNLSSLPSGFYIIAIENATGQKVSQKLIKQ